MRRASHVVISFALVLAAVASVVAQAPKPGAPATGTAAATTAASTGTVPATSTSGTASSTANVQQTLQEILQEPASTDTYRYDPQGRRDPFQSLVGPRPALQPGQRPPGLPGFMVDELKLQGIVRTGRGLAAMVNGPDNKGYLIHVGDKLLDGEVIRMTQTSVVFRQEVNDPTRIERFREVTRDLSPAAAPGKK